MSADDVGGSLLLLPGGQQLLFVLCGLPADLRQLFLTLCQFLRQLRRALGDLVRPGSNSRQLCLGLGRPGHLLGLPAAQLLQLGRRRRCRIATAAHFLAEGCYLVFQGPGGGVYFLHAPGHDLHLLVQGLRAAAALAHLPIHALDGLGVVLSRGPSHGGGGFMLADGALQSRDPSSLFLGSAVVFMEQAGAFLRLGIYPVQLVLGLFLVGLGRLKIRLQLQPVRLQLLQVLQPDADLQGPQLIPEHQVFLGRLRLLAQGLHLQLQLCDLIVDAHQVLLCALELPLGLLLAVAVLADARRLLEYLPPIVAADGEDLIDLTLANDGIALPAHAGVHEQLIHVLEPHGLAVDIILRLPAAVIAAGHRHLRLIAVKYMLGIVNDQRHLGKAHGPALFGAAEDYILHLGAAKLAAVLLAHDPADGIGYIGLSGPIGAHDGGDVLAKV